MLNMKKFQNAKILDSKTSIIQGGTFKYEHSTVTGTGTGTVFIGNAYKTYENRQTITGQNGEIDVCGVITYNGDAPNSNP